MSDTDAREKRLQFLRAVFDGFPTPAFIVDEQMRIHDFNSAAELFLGADAPGSLHRKSGDAFHCMHALAQGCGNSDACQDCAIRNSVYEVLNGRDVLRRWHEAYLRRGPMISRVDLFVTASLLPYTEGLRVLLVLESFSELVRRTPPLRKT